MSRKKKQKDQKKLLVPNGSFMRIKSQIRKQHSSGFNTWVYARGKERNKVGQPKKFFFPYSKRVEPALKLCGKYEILPEVPDGFKELISSISNNVEIEEKRDQFVIFLNSITKEEFKDGKVSNERLHEFLKKSNLVGKIKKPKLIPIIEYFCETQKYMSRELCNKMIELIVNRGTKKSDMHIYISCDPWDIFRMGVGNKSFDSCMNTITGRYSHCTRCPYNFCDSNMLVCFTEKESDYQKANGMIARMIVRVLKTNDGYGAVFDRLYGERNLRGPMEEVLSNACKKIGIKYLVFENYMYESHNHARINPKGNKIIASTNINKFPSSEGPYLDNPGGHGFKKIGTMISQRDKKKHEFMSGVFSLIERE